MQRHASFIRYGRVVAQCDHLYHAGRSAFNFSFPEQQAKWNEPRMPQLTRYETMVESRDGEES
jgi:hypothetical protein